MRTGFTNRTSKNLGYQPERLRPLTGDRRRAIHGKLQPMDQERRTPPLWAFLVAFLAAWFVAHWIMGG